MHVNDGLSVGNMNISERQNDILTSARTKGRVSVEGLAEAFAVTPQTIRRDLNDLCRRGLLARLRARVEAQPPEVVEALFRKHFGVVCARFLEALQQALPELDKQLVADRFRLALGTLSCAFSGNFDLDTIPGHPPVAVRLELKVQRLVEFLAAGLRAPDGECP